jgi:hypothetical protein
LCCTGTLTQHPTRCCRSCSCAQHVVRMLMLRLPCRQLRPSQPALAWTLPAGCGCARSGSGRATPCTAALCRPTTRRAGCLTPTSCDAQLHRCVCWGVVPKLCYCNAGANLQTRLRQDVHMVGWWVIPASVCGEVVLCKNRTLQLGPGGMPCSLLHLRTDLLVCITSKGSAGHVPSSSWSRCTDRCLVLHTAGGLHHFSLW